MTPSNLPRPDGVGRRAPTTGLSSHHLNGNGARTMPDPDLGGPYVVAYALCAFSGFLVGVLVGALLL
jgi:hypothetical protein